MIHLYLLFFQEFSSHYLIVHDLRFLYGLSIRHIGIETAKDISSHFGTFEKLWSYLLKEVEKEVEKNVVEEADCEVEVEVGGADVILSGKKIVLFLERFLLILRSNKIVIKIN